MLTSFGELLQSQRRPGDVACRFGGEEFCLLLPNTDAHTARRRLNALLNWWRGVAFHFDAETSTGNAFSAGVTDSFLVPGDAPALIGAAQACLAEAKRLGRNRVLVFDTLAGAGELPE
jgi:diguanylate cyclase (GGDEF)-like protein